MKIPAATKLRIKTAATGLPVREGVARAPFGTGSWFRLWYDMLPHLIACLFFGRIRLHGAERIPPSGPTLFLGLHRNGAADGWVYAAALPRAVDFMISVQLRRHSLGRLMATGIEVVRDKDDGDRSRNAQALAEAADRLMAGGAVFVFPEGTSTLGPSHLPFRTGAARLACEVLHRGGTMTVVPLAIHYEAPTRLGGDVHIVPGKPIRLGEADRAIDMAVLHERFSRAIECTGIAFAGAADQRAVEQLARIASHGGGSYIAALRRPITTEDRLRLAALDAAITADRPLTWLDAPVAARRIALPKLLAAVAGCALVGAGLLLNAGPAALGWWAAHRLADDRNTIMFWRIMVGVLSVIAWFMASFAASLAIGAPQLTLIHVATTVLAARLHAVSRCRFTEGWNALFHRGFTTVYREVQDHVLNRLPE